MSRKQPTLEQKLAACVRELLGIPWDHARLMTADQMLSLVQFDHDPFYHSQHKDEPWIDNHWNLNPKPIRAHRKKTSKIDVPQIAKTDRISREQEEFRARLLTPRDQKPARKSRFPSRPFQKRPKVSPRA